MGEVCAIILAAGLSRRMGARNKLLLPIGGVPMIRHVVSVYQQVTDCVIVVTGHESDAVEAALDDSGAKTVFNPDYAQGQPTSVARGLRAAPSAATLLMGLGDQPYLTRDDLQSLIEAHHGGDPNRISIPMHDTHRGNPIALPASLRGRLLADRKSPGCKSFTRAHPEHVQFHALAAPGFYTDVDTPEAYRALSDATPERAL